MNNLKDSYGFTLVELIVVIAILSGLLAFSLPVFRNVDPFSGSDTQMGQVARLINDLKARAVEKNIDYFMNINTASGKVWVSDETMDEDGLDKAKDKAFTLTEGLGIADIEFPGTNKTGTGQYRIRFRKQGYSDFALIHLTNDDKNLTLRIEPFLSRVQLLDDHVSLEDCI